jgi:esterase/lipase superfamily enzyme
MVGAIANRSSGGASRRAVLRSLATAASSLALGGCAAVSAPGLNLDGPDLSTASPSSSILVATTRKPAGSAGEKPWFGSERAKLSVARAKLIAPDAGRFSLASFGLEDWKVDKVELLAKPGALYGEGARDVLIYVHGFNQTFETATLDTARLAQGIDFRGDTVVFAWPSKAKLLDYAYDRESAMWSRDALEQVLTGFIRSRSTGRVHVVAHSVGTSLTMEALRQIYIRLGLQAIERTGAVVFAAPDIDMDVFSSSVERVGALASRITVITATNDRALAVSGWIAGASRVGAAEAAALKKFGVRVIDASQEGWGIVNHDLFLSNAQIRQVIKTAVDGRLSNGT